MLDREAQIKTASSMVATLCSSNFYGEVQFKFEQGNIVHVRLIRNLKIHDEVCTSLGTDSAPSTVHSSNIPTK